MIDKIRNAVKKMNLIKWGKFSEKCIRLQFGENPEIFPLSKEYAKKELENINLYPDPEKLELRNLIAKKEGFKKENIFIGSGIDGLIELVAKVFIEKDDEVILPIPTFPAYFPAVELMEGKIVKEYLKKDFSLDLESLLAKITKKTKLMYISNPNNPTGNLLLTKNQIEKILQNFSGILVIDEAYFEFAGFTAIDLVKKYKNLIVFRGFSKAYGLAGLRVGYAVANEEVINFFEKTEGSSQVFAVNRVALASAKAVLENPREAQNFVNNFLQRKKEYEINLAKIEGVEVLSSHAAFSLFKTKLDANIFKEKMLEKNIAMKSMAIFEGVPKNLVYSAVPNKENEKEVLEAVKSILE